VSAYHALARGQLLNLLLLLLSLPEPGCLI